MTETIYYQLPGGVLGSSYGFAPPEGAELLDADEYERRLAASRQAAIEERRARFEAWREEHS